MEERSRKRAQASESIRRELPEQELEAVNARIRSKRNAPEAIRQTIEVQIERKAKSKRSREVPASASFKRTH
jgi:hypothetical protein